MGMRCGTSKKSVGSIYIDNAGSICIALTNKTGGNSVVGESCKVSATTANAVASTGSNDDEPIGTFQEAGIADAAVAWIAVSGRIPFKADAGGIALDDWLGTSGTAKLTDGDATAGGTSSHFQEQGHTLEAAASGAVAYGIGHNN